MSEFPFKGCITFIIYSTVSGHLGCFYHVAIVNDATANMGVQVSFQDPVFSQFGYIMKMVLLGSMVIVFLIFEYPSYWFPRKNLSFLFYSYGNFIGDFGVMLLGLSFCQH
jgi:hypothetical protein